MNRRKDMSQGDISGPHTVEPVGPFKLPKVQLGLFAESPAQIISTFASPGAERRRHCYQASEHSGENPGHSLPGHAPGARVDPAVLESFQAR